MEGGLYSYTRRKKNYAIILQNRKRDAYYSIFTKNILSHNVDVPEKLKIYAKNIIDDLPGLRSQFPGVHSPFVLFSDEWYILAGEHLPPSTEYGDTDLIENGVGQVRYFLDQFE